MPATPLVAILMGSKSDWETMRHAVEILTELGVPVESKVVSAHRTPERLFAYGIAIRPAHRRMFTAGLRRTGRG